MGNKLKITRPSRRKQRIRAIQNTIGGILALGAIMLTVHCYQLSNGVDVVDRIRYGSENYTVRFRVADTDYKCPKGFTCMENPPAMKVAQGEALVVYARGGR